MWTTLGNGLAHALVERGEGAALRHLGAGVFVHVLAGDEPAVPRHTSSGEVPAGNGTAGPRHTAGVHQVPGEDVFEIVEEPTEDDLALFASDARRVAHSFVPPDLSRLALTEEAARGVDLGLCADDTSGGIAPVKAHVNVRSTAQALFRDPAERVREMRERRARFPPTR